MSTHSGPTAVIFFLLRMYTGIQVCNEFVCMVLNGCILYNKIHTTPTERQLGSFNTLETILFTRSYLAISECVTDITVASVIFLSVSYTLDGPAARQAPKYTTTLTSLSIDQNSRRSSTNPCSPRRLCGALRVQKKYRKK
ncbi:hypothetical protein EDC04DRAFT_1407051 [Pisolithus marmoratus]|nr:hypothetical protein EDC04DRAFT_1407051 [Pisolithus marmoratus]